MTTMTGADLLPEFDMEMANTRKTLERVPDDRLDYKVHDKSFSLLQLARHISNIPSWAPITLLQDELDMSGPFERDEPTNVAEILADFDKNVTAAREVLEGATAEVMASMWTLKQNGETMFSMPKAMTFRLWVMNHAVHHRGQLTVNLRLLDIPVPSLYGPSADEAS
jgi:uncharacterized damage-inducible protein DinB